MVEIDEYMLKTDETVVYPAHIQEESDEDIYQICYIGLKLSGEVGEVNEHIGKCVRDDNGHFTQERIEKLSKEIGDVFWYLCRLCRHFNLKLSDVLEKNLNKLFDRKKRGVIKGDGSDR